MLTEAEVGFTRRRGRNCWRELDHKDGHIVEGIGDFGLIGQGGGYDGGGLSRPGDL